MNIQEFQNQFSNCKDVDLIKVSCDHPLHSGILKPIKAVSVRRNILKHGGEKFICRACCMRYENPMQKKEQPARNSLGIIEVECSECKQVRSMESVCYFGSLTPPYLQICGTCAQKGKEISEEQKKKISETLTGRELSEEHKSNIAEYMKNNPEGIERAKNNLIPGQGGGWNTGKETPLEVKKKQSDAMIGKEKTLQHRLNISLGRKKMLGEVGGFTREHREKLSKSTIEQYARGFEPKMFHLSGWHFSTKLNKLIFHRSSYEKKRYLQLDLDDSVINYEPEVVKIEYLHPEKKITSIYLADLLVTYFDGHQEIEEVKPEKWLDDPVVLAKLEAGENWSQETGVPFNLILETDLYGDVDTIKKTREFSDWLKLYLQSANYQKMLEEKMPKAINSK